MLKTLDNALIILNYFTGENPSWGTRELAKATGINHSTVSKTLLTFKKHGLLMKNGDTQKYELGYKLLEYYSTLKERIEFVDELSSTMQRISEQTKETVFLNVMEENSAVCIKIVENNHDYLRFAIKVGNRNPLHLGSRGKVMLAFLEEEQQESIIDANLGMGDSDIRDNLFKDLKEIREKGWCLTIGERFKSIVGISIPLFDKTGSVISSLTIGALKDEINDAKVKEYVEILQSHKKSIESLLAITQK